MSKKKVLIIVIIVAIVAEVAAIAGYFVYRGIWKPVKDEAVSSASGENAVFEEPSTEAIAADSTDTTVEVETDDENSEDAAEEAEALESEIVCNGYVVIDPGHQAPSVDMSALEPIAPGATETKAKATSGTTGKYSGVGEYQLVLDIGLMLRDELEARGYQVLMTREDNTKAISNAERATLANMSGADILVRLHADGSEDTSVSGASALVPGTDNPYVPELAGESYALGEAILTNYCEATGFNNRGVVIRNDLSGNNWSKIPVMVLEMGFMSNETDDTAMQKADVQAKMVQGIADGIEAYYAEYPSAYAASLHASTGETDTEEVSEEQRDRAQLQALAGQVQSELLKDKIDAGEKWSVAWVDLSTDATTGLYADQQMLAASEMKLFIMATAYAEGLSNMEDQIKLMITQSDNDAGNEIVTAIGDGDFSIGMNRVNAFCLENGYTGTHMGRKFLGDNDEDDNYTTANDCAQLLASIYHGTCVSEEASAQMLEYLKAQERRGKIPAGLDGISAEIANKTGELSDQALGHVENDVAIVYNDEKAYVLCVLSQDVDNGSAISTITQISSMTYGGIV